MAPYLGQWRLWIRMIDIVIFTNSESPSFVMYVSADQHGIVLSSEVSVSLHSSSMTMSISKTLSGFSNTSSSSG